MPITRNDQGGTAGWSSIYLHSRREAVVIFLIWLGALLWSVPYCYIYGYPHEGAVEEISLIWGMPSWVFGGILLPWLAANLLTTWFSFFYMRDDDLGVAPEDDVPHAKWTGKEGNS